MASVAKMSTNRHVTTPPSSRTVALSVRSKTPSSSSASRRSVTPNSRSYTRLHHDDDHYDHAESGRVRVAIRVRPKNTEEILSDADFFDCVEPQPELKKLKLKKNNWSSESYRFDEVFTESASQKRVYEAVAKPVVEELEKLIHLASWARMMHLREELWLGLWRTSFLVHLQHMIVLKSPICRSTWKLFKIYLHQKRSTFQLLKIQRMGKCQYLGQPFLQVLQIGEANRHAANTKMNTESSRSHAILMVSLRRSINDKEENNTSFQGKDDRSVLVGGHVIPTIRKSKLLIVDLAGSERLDKSGSEGHLVEETKFINLSLSSLGKCINALAENSPHIPTRDSKLTRLLRDSFGGSARTSLIVTSGPSSRHHTETASTIMFGQRQFQD